MNKQTRNKQNSCSSGALKKTQVQEEFTGQLKKAEGILIVTRQH